jgi:hypothetical protein
MATSSTSVSADPFVGWTIQQGPAPEAPESIPGNVILAEELPLAASLDAAGVDPSQYFANLHIVADEDSKAVARGEKEGTPVEVSAEEAVTEQEKDEKPAEDEKPVEDEA